MSSETTNKVGVNLLAPRARWPRNRRFWMQELGSQNKPTANSNTIGK